MAACGMCTAWKRFCCPHCIFAFLLTLTTAIFMTLGIAVIVISEHVATAVEEACSEGGSGSIKESMAELYSTADEIYCIGGGDFVTGCPCITSDGHLLGNKVLGSDYYTSEDTATDDAVTNVQQCKDDLEETFAEYGIEFDDLDGLVEYLDHFGTIEEEYECSGICNKQDKYYYWDSTQGEPPKRCEEPIREDVLRGEIKGFGIGYLTMGCWMFVVWFIQYGLCCRKKQPAGDTKRF